MQFTKNENAAFGAENAALKKKVAKLEIAMRTMQSAPGERTDSFGGADGPTLAPTTPALSQPPTPAPSTQGEVSTRNDTGGRGRDSLVAIGASVAVVLFLVVVGRVRR